MFLSLEEYLSEDRPAHTVYTVRNQHCIIISSVVNFIKNVKR